MHIVLPADRPRCEIPINDGDRVVLSPVLKTDREFFKRGLDDLSPESRFSRFGSGVGALSQRELDYLSDVDQRNHVAWGAAVDDEVAGVGRYVVSSAGDCPELAITVLDRLQRRGIGRALLIGLIAVARADGIEEMCFETRPDNEAVLRILSELEVAPLSTDGVLERRIRLSDLPANEYEPALVAVIDEVRGQASSRSSDAEFTQ